MSRQLIDRDELISALKKHRTFYVSACGSFSELPEKEQARVDEITVCIAELINAPTIDVVELPCKIGDKVWIARRYKCHKRPRWGIVSEMFFTDDMELCIVVKGVARGKWGVDVFATYEEAEEQIERNNRKD